MQIQKDSKLNSSSFHSTDSPSNYTHSTYIINQFKHISIPFDQLEMFNKLQESQEYLKETLLLSTLSEIIHFGKKHLCKIIITKSNVWFLNQISDKKNKNKNHQNKFKLPLLSILSVIKSSLSPQLVLVTTNTQDNMRLSCTSDDRCFMIISALSYAFTYFKIRKNSGSLQKNMTKNSFSFRNTKRSFNELISKSHQKHHQSFDDIFSTQRDLGQIQYHYLEVYFINQESLQFFERNKQDKIKGRNFSLAHYQSYQIVYQKPSSQKLIKFSQKKQKNKSKFQKKKQNHIQASNHSQNINFLRKKSSSSEDQKTIIQQFIGKITLVEKINTYFDIQYEQIHNTLPIAHRAKSGQIQLLSFTIKLDIQEQQDIISSLHFHVNHKQIMSLKAMKNNEFSFQLFFQKYQQLYSYPFEKHQLFQNLSHLYDFVKNIKKDQVFSTDMLFYSSRDKQIKFKQFRYKFLCLDQIYSVHKKLIYEESFKISSIFKKQKQSKWKEKYYNLGIVMYELVYGRCLFDLSTIQQIVYLKKNIVQVPFPAYIMENSDQNFRDFLSKCILIQFKSQEELTHHKWLSTTNNNYY